MPSKARTVVGRGEERPLYDPEFESLLRGSGRVHRARVLKEMEKKKVLHTLHRSLSIYLFIYSRSSSLQVCDIVRDPFAPR